MRSRIFAILSLYASLVMGCNTTGNSDSRGSSPTGERDAPRPMADACIPWAEVNPDVDVIEFQRNETGDKTCPANDEARRAMEPYWRITVNGRPICMGLSLEQEKIELGGRWYTVFTWPKDDEAVPDSLEERYAKLDKLMNQYSKLVGTCLHEEPVGAGAKHWVGGKRWDDWSEINTRLGDSSAWCQSVRKRLVETYVRPGSTFCQYGNCGEGGHIGACLAKRLGFRDNEIRLCSSKNDHMFAMVKDLQKPDGRWCILDRWNLIGHYRCDVDIDNDRQQVVYRTDEGAWDITGQNWFQRAGCMTIDKYMADPGSL